MVFVPGHYTWDDSDDSDVTEKAYIANTYCNNPLCYTTPASSLIKAPHIMIKA